MVNEEKWKQIWEERKIFESNPNEKEKFYITAAFPYPNSPQHIGHGRTYTIADIYARYNRMVGKNVLFPMGFHVTGTPIFAMAKRVAKGDKEIIDIFKRIYGIPDEDIKKLDDPRTLVLYFSKETEKGMKEMGYSIDWRRKFYTFDEKFNSFIEWQFKKLKERGYIKKGTYPLAYCPSCKNTLSSHDTKGDKDPEIEEVVLIKFKYKDGYLLASTYRPETIYGLTNIWINPNVKYIKAKLNNEIVYLADDAYKILKYQFPNLEKIEDVKIEGHAQSPLGKEVPILNAKFVSSKIGTGIVMSVPGHAPYDYIALKDLNSNIKPIKIIELKGYDLPAKDIVERNKIENQEDEKLKEITKELYREELKKGVMLVGPKGMPVEKARDFVKEDLIKKGDALKAYIIANAPVYCRCGTEGVVKILEDQWFIDYGNKEWKEKAKKCVEKMKFIPKKIKEEILRTIDWLREKPCARNSGFGTKLPFDEEKVIEPLSDSTIYPAFYTVSHLLDRPLSEEEWDYILLGKGEIKELEHLRKEFEYWYGVDSRHSGADLIRNHLTFYIFNHVAIFPEEKWPKQIVVNAFVTMDGKKMSKSLGNILPIRKAIKIYGADVIRLSIIGNADLDADSDFNERNAESIKKRLKSLMELFKNSYEKEEKKEDEWFLSKLTKRVKKLKEMYGEFKYRDIITQLFYETYNDLIWYKKRAKEMRLKKFWKIWIKAMAPIIPFTTEEMWSYYNKGLIEEERLDNIENEGIINEKAEYKEEMIKMLLEDIANIEKIIGKKAKKITIGIAPEWKRKAYNILMEEKNIGNAIKRFLNEGGKKEQIGIFKKLKINKLKKIYSTEEEKEFIDKEFIEKETNAKVEVIISEKGIPGKPSIHIE